MTTIAELVLKVDSTQAEKGTKALNDLATAADKAAKARKALNDAQNGAGGGGGGGGGNGDDAQARKAKNLSEAIDAQTRKLAALTAQRKLLNESNLRTENPEEYKRLNREIDSRTELVRRQGNSLDRLAAQADRQQKAKEAAEKADQRLRDQERKALEAKEAMEARFAAAQAKNLDATINGLSRQIKAQQEYNREIATLSLSRFQGRISGSEFDTYSRLASVKRDDALATADNTKELERNQRMLDSITSTLGKAERAEVTLKRAIDTLNQGLVTGLLTQEQYDRQLTRHVAKRDAAVLAANSNAAAETKLAAALQGVLSAYDPVIRATDSYSSSVKILAQGLQGGLLTIGQFNKALTEQRVALDAVKASQAGTPEYQAKQYQSLIEKLLPLNTQLRALAEQERVLKAQKDAGHVTTEQQIGDYNRATKAIEQQRKELERLGQAERRGNSAKQDAAALRGLPAQFTDVVVSLQGGQAPLTVLLQQGGQVKDMFGGVGNAIKAVTGALIEMINPVTVVGAALAVAAFGAYKANAELTSMKLTLATTGTVSGQTVSGMYDMAKSLDDVSYSTGQSIAVLDKLAATGTVTGENFELLARTIISYSKATGQSSDILTEQLAAIGKDPVSAVKNLIDRYGILDSSMLLSANQAVAYGEKRAIVTEIEKQAAIEMQISADKIAANLTDLQRFARATSEVFAKLGDSIANVWRGSGDKEMDAQEAIVKTLEGKITLGGAYGAAQKLLYQDEYDAQVKILDNLKTQRKEEAQKDADRKIALQDSAAAQERMISRYSSTRTAVESVNSEIKKQAVDWEAIESAAKIAGKTVSEAQIKQNEDIKKGLKVRLDAAKEAEANAAKGKSSPVDTRELQTVKSNQAAIISEYQSYYKKVTALGKAGVTSAEATFASQRSILEAEKSAVASSFDEQIASIKKLQSVKGNNAAQSLSLDNQLTRAQAEKLKAEEGYVTKLEVLSTQEKGFTDQRTESINAYNDALRQQIENVTNAGKRATAAVGQGDRQGSVNDSLAQADRQFAKDKLSLSKQLGKSMDKDEYDQKLADLTKAHTDMTNQILKNDQDLKDAEADWTNGATRAFQNYMDAGANLAKVMEDAVTGSFDKMSDSLAGFVTTGKLDFASLTSSILSDLAKLATKLALNTALKAVFDSVSSSGGWGGLISAGIGAVTGGGAAMAKGGAYNGGTQFFAKGGAFTNSVVNSPTSFTSSSGSNNVMGEAGPEAIMPLARTSDGSLGVRMVGADAVPGASGGGVNVYITIDNGGQASAETDSSDPLVNQFGKELGAFVENKYRMLLARDLKDGGAIKSAIKS